ncbi:hypothetical protein ACN22W_22255 [Burkholderia theae]|uniref:hypothetical protein n=1 Tax=Burkholderia theae TaxID=3143496 RepID=UPI003AFB3996
MPVLIAGNKFLQPIDDLGSQGPPFAQAVKARPDKLAIETPFPYVVFCADQRLKIVAHPPLWDRSGSARQKSPRKMQDVRAGLGPLDQPLQRLQASHRYSFCSKSIGIAFDLEPRRRTRLSCPIDHIPESIVAAADYNGCLDLQIEAGSRAVALGLYGQVVHRTIMTALLDRDALDSPVL